MRSIWPVVKHLLLAAVLVCSTLVSDAVPLAFADDVSPYRVTEFVVRVAPGPQTDAVVSGDWVLWRDDWSDPQRIWGRNLDTGTEFSFPTGNAVLWPVDVAGDLVVATELDGEEQYGIFGYRLPDGTRLTIAAPETETEPKLLRSLPRTDGKTVVWAEGSGGNHDIHGYDVAAQRHFVVSSHPADQDQPAVSGDFVVWRDRRNAEPNGGEQDIYAFNRRSGEELRLTTRPEIVSPPAISGNLVVWSARRGDVVQILGYDLTKRQELAIAQLPSLASDLALDVAEGLVVWAAPGELDQDVFGYDVQRQEKFIISQAIGSQSRPQISGRTVVWVDSRRGGVGRNEGDTDVYGARLEAGPGPIPPVVGALDAVDAKVEIVWPHGDAAVDEAEKVNVAAWLFAAGTLDLAPCQWNPRVRLWSAVDNEPARPIATGWKVGRYFTPGGRAVPTWEFDNVDVAAARDPAHRISFFVTVDGVMHRSNVWVHAVDARTYFPQPDVVTGISAVPDTVDAKIEIVWPHGDAPVLEATKVNVMAMLFAHDTSQSVPPEWSPTVRLYAALDNDVSREVAVGQKRLVQRDSLVYPVWDFNDVDVSAATDPQHKYHFTIAVDGVTTHTNVWTHGADARTQFPEVDQPTASCS